MKLNTAWTALCALGLGATCAMAAAAPARQNDFPTVERVRYVQQCMRSHPGSEYEMVSKCSCAVDAMAEQVSYDDYVNMTTVVNAISISGERGGELRDNPTVKPQIQRYKALQAQVEKGCFIGPPR